MLLFIVLNARLGVSAGQRAGGCYVSTPRCGFFHRLEYLGLYSANVIVVSTMCLCFYPVNALSFSDGAVVRGDVATLRNFVFFPQVCVISYVARSCLIVQYPNRNRSVLILPPRHVQ